MDVWGFVTLAVVGFTACAEFGSYAFVHPVVRRLPAREHIQVEQGLLRTFGRVMPVAMTLCVVLSISNALRATGEAGPAESRWVAAGFLAAALVSTIVVNVPINLATGTWDSERPPPNWQQTRTKWEFFQGVRSWLLLFGFLALCVGFTVG
ncbi:MAG: DUF1772 domain-containing protein [Actinomycetota bacterium]|nr:DUF1772 domain-containing protein [Actinomycetota bacterium]